MDNDEESRPIATRSRGNRPKETPALPMSSNTSLSTNVNVQETARDFDAGGVTKYHHRRNSDSNVTIANK